MGDRPDSRSVRNCIDSEYAVMATSSIYSRSVMLERWNGEGGVLTKEPDVGE